MAAIILFIIFPPIDNCGYYVIIYYNITEKLSNKAKEVAKLANPSIALKQKAVDLMYETGKYILETYDCFEE